MSIGFKLHAFRFQQHPLLTPPWCRAPLFIHHPMAGQLSGPRRIPQRPSHANAAISPYVVTLPRGICATMFSTSSPNRLASSAVILSG